MNFDIQSQEQAAKDGVFNYVRKTLNPLEVHEVKLVKTSEVEDGQWGVQAQAMLVATAPTEGLENEQTGNCQYVRFNLRFGDQGQKTIDKFIKLAERLGKYDDFTKQLATFRGKPEADIANFIFGYFTEPFAILVSQMLETSEEGKDVSKSYINTGRSWCRSIANKGELVAELEKNKKDFTWDRRVVNEPETNTEGGDSDW